MSVSDAALMLWLRSLGGRPVRGSELFRAFGAGTLCRELFRFGLRVLLADDLHGLLHRDFFDVCEGAAERVSMGIPLFCAPLGAAFRVSTTARAAYWIAWASTR